MRFKIDENLPPAVADLMREIGHDEIMPVAGRLWIVDEHRIRVRLVGEIDLGPKVREVSIE